MPEPTQPPTPDNKTTIPGWDRPAWAVRGVKAGPELIWQREASVDVTYTDGGVEATFAPELIRTDQVSRSVRPAPPCTSARRLSTSRMPRTSRRRRAGSWQRRWWSWPTYADGTR